jgi:uncharacterized membrane protein HdeD (DUF308 family)
MDKSARGRLLFIAAGVICLVSAAVIVWRRALEGLTAGDLLTPLAFALMGVFWLLYGLKATGAKDA